MTAPARLYRAPRHRIDVETDYAEATFLAALERFGAHRQSAGMCVRNSPEWQHQMDLSHADRAALIAEWHAHGGTR